MIEPHTSFEFLIAYLSSILMATAAVISSVVAWKSTTHNAKEIEATKKVVKEGNVITEETRRLVNGQLEEFKKALIESAIAATREALQEGKLVGRAELTAESAIEAKGRLKGAEEEKTRNCEEKKDIVK